MVRRPAFFEQDEEDGGFSSLMEDGGRIMSESPARSAAHTARHAHSLGYTHQYKTTTRSCLTSSSSSFSASASAPSALSSASAAASHFVIEFLRLTPPLALIPVLILWLGIDEAPKIAIVFLSSFFPIYLSALTAVKGIDPKLAEVAELLGFTSAERFRMLTLPAAMPGILAGLRMGFGYSWRALVGAELIAASSGLGFLITESSEFGKTDVVFVGIFTIVGLGIAADAVISRLVSALSRRISEAA